MNKDVVKENNEKEKEEEGDLWGIIVIQTVLDNVFDSFDEHDSEINNKLYEAVLIGISDICIELDSNKDSPNVCNKGTSYI